MSAYHNNSLNKSKSKQLYSFSKSPRFATHFQNEVIDAFYENRVKNKQKSYSFAKSHRLKTEDYVNKNSSDQFLYNIEGEIQKQLKRKSGVKILYGRQDCKSKGIFLISENPGPGNYNPNPEAIKVRISSECSMGNSLRDKTLKQESLPGPGYYNVQSSLLNEGKILSKDIKRSYGKMIFDENKPSRTKTENNPEIRFPEINNKGDQAFKRGRGFMIGKSSRFSNKVQTEEPGPGSYKIYSEFLQPFAK